MPLLLALAALVLPAGAAGGLPPEQLELRVMTFNILYGGDEVNLRTNTWCASKGCPGTLAKVVEAIRASEADIVGLEEAEHNTTVIAEALGWYASERLQIVSRYPLIDPPDGRGVYVFAELAPGRVVALANVHLPSDPYGPYLVRDGIARSNLRAVEEAVRLSELEAQLETLPALAEAGIPVFLTGDFNSPSHLDWTVATASARPEVRYPFSWPVSVALERAGFRDSYRAVHPDPVAVPGFTWTPGGPESGPREVHDRIDWVLAAGPATALESRIVGELAGPDVDVAVDPYPSDHRGVVSTFSVTPAVAPVLVAVERRRLSVGDDLPVVFHAPGEPGERILIVPAGGPPDGALEEAPTGAGAPADGALSLPTGSLAAGAYEALLLGGDGAVLSRSPFWLFEPGAPTEVTTSKRRYRVGERITVRWSNAPGMRWDWLGIYKPRAGWGVPFATTCNAGLCGNGNYLLYEYTGASIEGSLSFTRRSAAGAASWPLPPGRYEVRLLLDDGYRLVARSERFTVVPR